MAGPLGSGIQLIDDALIDATLARARLSPRLRANHNLHASHADGCHRFLNAWLLGSYAAPHRHLAHPKPESFVMLRGKLACFVFDDSGQVEQRRVLGEGGLLGIDLPPGVWHTVLPLSAEAVCFEVKLGPWDAATDKEFAPWAPLEGAPEAAAYARSLLTGLRQD